MEGEADGVEPITVEEENRFTLLPLRYPAIFDFYKELEAMFWTAQEVQMKDDPADWRDRLSAGDRAFYSHILALFGPADEKVMKNLDSRFTQEIKVMEILYAYGEQGKQERVHSESYSIMIDILLDGKEKEDVFNAVLNMPVIAKMMAWVDKWIASDARLGIRIAAWAIFEGVLFQGQFMAIQLLKERNLMSGLTSYNELISRDEGRHCAFACLLITDYIIFPPSRSELVPIVTEAIDLYDEFLKAASAAARSAEGLPPSAPCPVEGISEPRMQQYVRNVADVVCSRMGFSPIFKVENPYPEADKLTLNEVEKVNFFEHIPTQYNHKVDLAFELRGPARRELLQPPGAAPR